MELSHVENSDLRIARVRRQTDPGETQWAFLITLENPSSRQVILDAWEATWTYYPGHLNEVTRAEFVAPTALHVIELPIDPSGTAPRNQRFPIEPTTILPAASALEPSVYELELELRYFFDREGAYHAKADWNILVSLAITTTDDETVPVLEEFQWRQ